MDEKMAKSDDLIRCFVCLNVPEEWERALWEISEPLKKLRSRISWVKSFHLTLKFLGEISPDSMERVRRVLAGTVHQFPTFFLTLGQVECFLVSRSPKILWVGVETETETLINLQNKLEEKLAKNGFKRDKRRFAPHLTLGRIRRFENSDRLAERLNPLICPQVSPFEVKSVELMQSRLEKGGAVYSVLDSYTLLVTNYVAAPFMGPGWA